MDRDRRVAAPGQRRWRRRVGPLTLATCALLTVGFGTAGASSTGALGADTVVVTNLNANTVSAINVSTHAVTVIKSAAHPFNGPLGVAITPNGTTAYVTNSLGNTVTPIDLESSPATVGNPIRVGLAPSAIAIAPNGRFAYVTNFDSNTVTPIDLASSPVTAQRPIPVGAGPWSIAVSPDGRDIIVSNSEATSVSIISAATRRVSTLQVGGRPQAIAISPDSDTAYVANANQITPIDLASTPAVAERPIPLAAQPLGIAVSPTGRTAYVASADNTVTPIQLKTRPPTVGTTVPTGSLSQPDGITISTNGETAYIADAGQTVTPINLTTSPLTVMSPIDVGAATFGIAVRSDQAPTARLTITPAPVGQKSVFNASASTSPDGRISRYAWNFGDGTTLVSRTPVVTHVYKRAGTYHATVTVTSAGGTSIATTYTGQTVSNHGSASARAARTFFVVAVLRASPSTSWPGGAVSLRDTTFLGRCRPVDVRFDKNLIAQTSPKGQLLDVKRLVVPGDATLGEHRISLACSASGPALLSVQLNVVAHANHLSEFSIAMPTLGEVGRNLPAAGGASVVLILLSRLLGAGFPSEWIDRSYEENRERFVRRWRRRFPRLMRDRAGDPPPPMVRRLLGGSAIFLGFAAFGGLVNSILDPSFGWNRTTLWLFIGQCIGIGVVSVTGQIPTIVVGLRTKKRVRIQVLLGGLAIAVVCVGASRAIGLSPGYCYGLIATFLVIPDFEAHEMGKLHALGSLCVLVVSSTAFLLTHFVYQSATSSTPSLFSLIAVPALDVIFLAGFASLAFGMFPLPFLPGRHVAKWNETIWLSLSGLGLIGFVAVLLTPGSGSSAEQHHVGLIPMLVAFAVFAVLSLSALLYFHRHPLEHKGDEAAEALEVPEAPAGLATD